MALKELLPGGAEVWRSKGGELTQWFPAPGVLCHRLVGDLSGEFFAPMLDALNRVAGEAPLITTFGDAELVTGYDIVLRVRLVIALQKIRHQLDKIHVYSRSKAVVTAMRAANLVLGNVVAHGSRKEFEAALAKVVAERTRGP